MTTPAVWRTTLVPGDPDRNWTYVWNIDGDLDPSTFRLRDAGGVDHTVTQPLYLRPGSGWEGGYHVGFSVAADLAAGAYALRHRGATIATVTVQSPTGAPTTYLTPRTGTADALEAALAYNDVVLAPGLYALSRTIRLTARRKVSGYGAVVTRAVGADPDYQNRMFIAADGVTFAGVHFIGDTFNGGSNSGFVMHNDFGGADAVFRDCVFQEAQLGFWSPQFGLLVQGCRFVRGSAGSLRSGLVYNCRWEGLPLAGHAFLAEAGNRLAAVGLTMEGTDRGLVLRDGFGPLENCLFTGLNFRNIAEVDNGCEIITTEGGSTGVAKCLFTHIRASGCIGEFNIWDAPMTDCVWRDVACDGARFSLSGLATQERNHFSDFELRHGTFQLGPLAKHNVLERIVCISPVHTRANEFSFDPSSSVAYVNPTAAIQAAGDGAGTNTVKDCIVRDPATGMTGFDGVTVLTPTPRV